MTKREVSAARPMAIAFGLFVCPELLFDGHSIRIASTNRSTCSPRVSASYLSPSFSPRDDRGGIRRQLWLIDHECS
jgi:hypothetical protein